MRRRSASLGFIGGGMGSGKFPGSGGMPPGGGIRPGGRDPGGGMGTPACCINSSSFAGSGGLWRSRPGNGGGGAPLKPGMAKGGGGGGGGAVEPAPTPGTIGGGGMLEPRPGTAPPPKGRPGMPPVKPGTVGFCASWSTRASISSSSSRCSSSCRWRRLPRRSQVPCASAAASPIWYLSWKISVSPGRARPRIE